MLYTEYPGDGESTIVLCDSGLYWGLRIVPEASGKAVEIVKVLR